jgi:hypothetical protein
MNGSTDVMRIQCWKGQRDGVEVWKIPRQEDEGEDEYVLFLCGRPFLREKAIYSR